MRTDNNSKNEYIDLGGTIRACLPAETIKKLTPLLSEVGITRIANVTGLDTVGIPVALSIRPNAKHVSVSQGKGIHWELAWLSAVMESFEGYHAENPRTAEISGSYRELNSVYPLVNPTTFSKGFFSISDLQNFSMPWVSAQDLVSQQKKFLPHTLICLDSSVSHKEYGFFAISSNGLAAGNSMEEATCHALYEIIERDSLYRFAQLSTQEKLQQQIDLTTISSSVNQSLLEKYKTAGIVVNIWDITTTLGIPSYYCEIADPDVLRGLNLSHGSGAHLNKEIALARALTEAAQTRLTLISGSRDDIFIDYYQRPLQNTGKTAGKKNYSSSLQPAMHKSFSETMIFLIETLVKHEHTKIFLVDQTKPELNIPVVHVFVPSLHFTGARI